MAVWIKATPNYVMSETVTPANGQAFTLDELQRMVGGDLEALPLENGTIMWLDEEGKLKNLPFNILADMIAERHSNMAWDDFIVGNVVIATRAESGEEEGEAETEEAS